MSGRSVAGLTSYRTIGKPHDARDRATDAVASIEGGLVIARVTGDAGAFQRALDGLDDRVAIIAVDYPNRRRIKLLGHATFDPQPDPARLTELRIDGRVEGLVIVEVVAYSWNCPKYITQRYTTDEVQEITEGMSQRITELEAQLAQARSS